MTDRLDDPQVFLPDLFETHGRHNRDKPAVICAGTTRNWGDFAANINRVANGLVARGIGKGDKVAICMGNSVEMLECLFGAVRAGACVVPLSGLLTADQLAHLVLDSGARTVFASPEFREKLETRQDRLGEIGLWIGHGFEDWTPLSDLTDGMATTPPDVLYDLTDDFNIIYSSGTTGLPKGIVQTHRARLHWAFSNATEMSFSAGSRGMTTTALYSNGTWLMMLPCLFAGGTLYVMDSFGADEFLRLVEDERITHTFMVPPQFTMVLDRPAMESADLSSLECVLCAGSPLRRELKRQAMERISPRLFELYGFSEGFATMLRPHQHAKKFETVGTPVIGFEVRILDDEGRELDPGEAGEIAGYGAGNMKEYLNQPELTADLIWRDERGRSFIRSGDVGALDEDGYLSLLDRKKDMIISGGFNVFPADIEEVVGQHPQVRDVTVIGVPHDKWGETCLALVIPAEGAEEEAIRDWANERLAKHQRLNAVEFRDDFPRNALGKVVKKELRGPYWEE